MSPLAAFVDKSLYWRWHNLALAKGAVAKLSSITPGEDYDGEDSETHTTRVLWLLRDYIDVAYHCDINLAKAKDMARFDRPEPQTQDVFAQQLATLCLEARMDFEALWEEVTDDSVIEEDMDLLWFHLFFSVNMDICDMDVIEQRRDALTVERAALRRLGAARRMLHSLASTVKDVDLRAVGRYIPGTSSTIRTEVFAVLETLLELIRLEPWRSRGSTIRLLKSHVQQLLDLHEVWKVCYHERGFEEFVRDGSTLEEALSMLAFCGAQAGEADSKRLVATSDDEPLSPLFGDDDTEEGDHEEGDFCSCCPRG